MSGGRWGFDLESNGLLDTIHTIWCIVCREIDTGEVLEYGPSEIKQALDLLSEADEIIGHNILDYDIPAYLTMMLSATTTLRNSRNAYGGHIV